MGDSAETSLWAKGSLATTCCRAPACRPQGGHVRPDSSPSRLAGTTVARPGRPCAQTVHSDKAQQAHFWNLALRHRAYILGSTPANCHLAVYSSFAPQREASNCRFSPNGRALHLPANSSQEQGTLPSAGLFRNLDSSGLGVCCGRKSTMLRGVASLGGPCKREKRRPLLKKGRHMDLSGHFQDIYQCHGG